MRFAPPLLAIAVLSLSPAARAADVAYGKAIFDTTCRHSMEVGVNKVGPSLWHIV